MVTMNNNRATPTLTCLQAGVFDTIQASSMVTNTLTASAFGGGCITSSLVSTSATTAASALALATLYASTANALPTTGGTITGGLTVIGQLCASNMTVLGTQTTVNSVTTVTSNVTINNAGTGPALVVTQSETGPMGAQPVAGFYNGAGTVALVIDNNGNVGVNRPTADFELDVSGVAKTTELQVGSVNGNAFFACSAELPQSGTQTSFGIGSGSYIDGATKIASVTFPVAYTRPPRVTISMPLLHVQCSLILGTVTSTVFSYSSTNNSGMTQTFTSWVLSWMATPFAADVGGSLKTGDIVARGSISKQIDCGTFMSYEMSYGTYNTVNFHFPFNNIPNVVCTVSQDLSAQLVLAGGVAVFDITNTSFKFNCLYFDPAVVSLPDDNGIRTGSWNMTWIAIG